MGKRGVPKSRIKTAADQLAVDQGCWWDQAAVDYVMEFGRDMLVNWERDENTGLITYSPFSLFSWQANNVVAPLFGWKLPNNLRRFRTGSIWVAKRNGKSRLCSFITAVMLYADNEPNAKCFSAATTFGQAGLIYEAISNMLGDELLAVSRRVPSRQKIEVAGNYYRALSKDADVADGIDAHCIIIDELHRHKNRGMLGLLKHTAGSRKQPLTLSISTAGDDVQSPGYEEYVKAKNILGNVDKNIHYFAYIAECPQETDWITDEALHLANPSIKEMPWLLDDLKIKRAEAQQSRHDEAEFRRYRLNQWTTSSTTFFDMSKWDACKEDIDWSEFEGSPCRAGLDLSSTSDTTSLVLMFPRQEGDEIIYYCLPFFWLPEQDILAREKRDMVPYYQWWKDGYLTLTPGARIDYRYIRKTINELAEKYEIREIGHDRWGASKLSQELSEEDGLTMTEIAQDIKAFDSPTKEIERIVTNRTFRHDGNPVLRWQASNTKVYCNINNCIKPEKRGTSKKIDGIVAAIMALNCVQKSNMMESDSSFEGEFARGFATL